MKNTCPFYIACQVLKVLLIIIYKIQPPSHQVCLFLSYCFTFFFLMDSLKGGGKMHKHLIKWLSEIIKKKKKKKRKGSATFASS